MYVPKQQKQKWRWVKTESWQRLIKVALDLMKSAHRCPIFLGRMDQTRAFLLLGMGLKGFFHLSHPAPRRARYILHPMADIQLMKFCKTIVDRAFGIQALD
jgi:hypothetical protein